MSLKKEQNWKELYLKLSKSAKSLSERFDESLDTIEVLRQVNKVLGAENDTMRDYSKAAEESLKERNAYYLDCRNKLKDCEENTLILKRKAKKTLAMAEMKITELQKLLMRAASSFMSLPRGFGAESSLGPHGGQLPPSIP